jgi:hypothetical protein
MAVGGSKSNSKSSSTTTNPYAIQAFQGAQSSLPQQYQATTADQIKGYMNPFQSSVIDATLARSNQNQALALNDVRDAATRSGAFGGSRQGVAEALTRGQFDLNNQQTIAGLNAENYRQALQTAQGENQYHYQYPLAVQALLGQLAQGTQTNTSGKQSGTQFGFGWTPKLGFNFGGG